jgi:competence protein ComGF
MRINQILAEERGFTLLESIFQLLIFILFASISLLIISWFRQIYVLDASKNDVNWELFIYDLLQYNELSTTGSVIGTKQLHLEMLDESDGRYFIFDKSDKHLRKTTNRGGNEIMLPNVKNWDLVVMGNELLIKVVMEDGTIRERKMVLPKAPQ